MSALRFGVNLDGALDSVRLRDIHFWPFALTALQRQAFFGGECYGIRAGKVDDLHVDGYMNIAHCGLLIEGQTFGHVVNSNFDTKMGIHMTAGSLQVAGCHFSSDGPPWIVHLGGQLAVSACMFFGEIAVPGINAQGATDSSLVISSSVFNTLAADVSSIESRGDSVIVTGSFFRREPNVDYTEPTVRVVEGRITFVGNRTRDKGTGGGTFVSIQQADSWHRVMDNAEVGWGMIGVS